LLLPAAVTRFSTASFLLSAAAPAQFPPDRGREIAFAGRSNAGKSSAINAILGRRGLARSGKTPGQTRLVNFFAVGAERRVVDLPGYGYARVPERERTKWGPLIESLRERVSLAGLFLIVDARRGVSEADLALIAWADPARRAIHVLLSKADKLTRREAGAALQEARRGLPAHAGVQLFSAIDGTGVAEAQRAFTQLLDEEQGK
jgi:GTP-binding protein